MEQLVVLDFIDVSVHIYNIASDYEPADMEDFISELGHHPSNCSWMFGQGVSIEFHKETIGNGK